MIYPQIAALIALIGNLALTLFVFSRDTRATLNRVFLLWGLAVSTWNLGALRLYQIQDRNDPSSALFWAYVLQLGVIFLPVANLHLCLLIARISIGRWLQVFYALHFAVALSLFTGWFIKGVRYVDNFAYYSVPGPFFWVFLALYIISTNSTMMLLQHKQKQLPPMYRARLRLLMLALFILILFGTNDLLPMFHSGSAVFYPPPFSQFKVYPFGNVGAVFYVFIIGYSALQHQLLDIHLVLSRLAAQFVRIGFMLLLGFVLLFLTARISPDAFSLFSFLAALGVLLVTAITASILFPRMFGQGEDTLERRILRDRFEYEDKIQGFIQNLPWYTDTALLLDDLNDLLAKTVNVTGYHLILLDETSRKFKVIRSVPEQPPGQSAVLERESAVFEHCRVAKADFLALNAAYLIETHGGLETRARRELEPFSAEFCFPFIFEEDPIGLLLIGPKKDGAAYSPHDLRLLTSMVKNLSLIMNQIRLKQRVLAAEEMELLGRMSRGMAHDLNNLITPIWTYLQLAHETARPEDSASELLPTVTRNVETMRSYIRESLFYSNTLTPHFAAGRLDQTVSKAADVMQPQLQNKGVTLKCDDLPIVELEMDSVLIQRLVSNLLGNAGDASPAGAEVEVRLAPLARTEAGRDWFRLQIIDHGSGISPEHLPHIFRPFFTTKDRGNEQRGFGLGLAICQKIVLMHGGNLSVASEEKKGTTVVVDLPSRRINSSTKNNNPIMAQAGIA